jgi:hypothetical protein
MSLSRNVSRNAFGKVGKGVNMGLGFVQNTGRGTAKHANAALSNVIRGPRGSRRRNNNGSYNNGMVAARRSRRRRNNMSARRRRSTA